MLNVKQINNFVDVSACAVDANRIREIIIDQSMRAKVGHIGSALSVADIIACLYGGVMNVPDPKDDDRDRFILSKGHAALAVYAALHLRGFIDEDALNTYCADNSALGVHPELVCPGIDFATGSLGQGLSFATGAALAAKRQNSQRRAFVLISDAEMNEGSVWEAIMFAAHHKLDNLVAIVDVNGQQAFGYTRDVIDLTPLEARWRAFNWNVHVVDGHNVPVMSKIIAELSGGPNGKPMPGPHVLLAQTTFGKGVSFMERQIKWHYSPLSPEEYAKAKDELRRSA
ncbi:MAG TPA: transketolase [Oculatellaceae cyanobacterium]